LAELKGATRKHPERYRKELPEAGPLGEMPGHLSKEAKAVWFELEAYALAGVLTGADRMLLETAAVLVAQFRKNPEEMPANKMGHMIGCLARLGMTPADRQKLGTEKLKEDDPFRNF
jgi:phage terminase small subunit